MEKRQFGSGGEVRRRATESTVIQQKGLNPEDKPPIYFPITEVVGETPLLVAHNPAVDPIRMMTTLRKAMVVIYEPNHRFNGGLNRVNEHRIYQHQEVTRSGGGKKKHSTLYLILLQLLFKQKALSSKIASAPTSPSFYSNKNPLSSQDQKSPQIKPPWNIFLGFASAFSPTKNPLSSQDQSRPSAAVSKWFCSSLVKQKSLRSRDQKSPHIKPPAFFFGFLLQLLVQPKIPSPLSSQDPKIAPLILLQLLVQPKSPQLPRPQKVATTSPSPAQPQPPAPRKVSASPAAPGPAPPRGAQSPSPRPRRSCWRSPIPAPRSRKPQTSGDGQTARRAVAAPEVQGRKQRRVVWFLSFWSCFFFSVFFFSVFSLIGFFSPGGFKRNVPARGWKCCWWFGPCRTERGALKWRETPL